MSKKPIMLILGPSAVGKSCILEALKKNYSFLGIHIDTDSKDRSFEANDFPSEWEQDYKRVDFQITELVIRKKLDEYNGAVISFPTLYVLSLKKLAEASEHGMTPIILWGTKKHCINACMERRRKKNIILNLKDYEKKNDPAFEAYNRTEYAKFIVEAFKPDGSRFSNDELLAQIMERASSNNGINNPLL